MTGRTLWVSNPLPVSDMLSSLSNVTLGLGRLWLVISQLLIGVRLSLGNMGKFGPSIHWDPRSVNLKNYLNIGLTGDIMNGENSCPIHIELLWKTIKKNYVFRVHLIIPLWYLHGLVLYDSILQAFHCWTSFLKRGGRKPSWQGHNLWSQVSWHLTFFITEFSILPQV